MDRPLFLLRALFLAGCGFAIVFLSWPEIDLWVAAHFADGTKGFPLRFHPVAKFFNEFINISAALLVLASFVAIAVTLWRKGPLLGLYRRHYAFILASIIVGPGLIANWVFKEHWGRARPRQITEFGSSADFTAPFIMTHQCETNCSFVSGDASMAFAFLALALIAPKSLRVLSVSLALLFGSFIGLVRMVQGAHFLSDVIFAGIFTCAAIILLYALMLQNYSPTAPKNTPLWRILFPKRS